MDLKARSKAANIIFSILIIILIVVPFIGFIPAFDANHLGFMTFAELRVNDTLYASNYLIDEWKSFGETLNHIGDYFSSSPAYGVSVLISALSFAVPTVFCGIVYLINFIICLIKTIKGFSGKSETCEVTNPLMAIAAALIGYVGVLAARQTLYSDIHNMIRIGTQPLIMLGCAFLMVVICAIIHLSRKDKSVVSKIFETIVGLGSLILATLILTFTIRIGNVKEGLIVEMSSSLTYLDYVTDGKSFFVGVFVSGIVIIAAYIFLCQLVRAAFGGTPTFKRKQNDYPKSLVIKSAIFFSFALIGFGVLLACLMMIKKSTSTDYHLGTIGYVALGLAVLFLGLSIANRVISNNFQAKPVEETKQEEEKKEEQKEEPKQKEPAQENKEELKEPVKEQYCPYCGSKMEAGKKFCSNCGAKLLDDTPKAESQTSNDKIVELSEKIADELEKRAEGK